MTNFALSQVSIRITLKEGGLFPWLIGVWHIVTVLTLATLIAMKYIRLDPTTSFILLTLS